MRVAVVDDEALARARLQRLLAAIDGVAVAGCCDGAEALLALLRREPVDALVLDIRMPGLDGLELAALLQERALPVVFVTAHADHAVEAFAVEAVDYVLKPVEAGRLRLALARVRARLEAREAQAQAGSLAAAAPATKGPPQRLALETATGVTLVWPAHISHASFDGQLVAIHLWTGQPAAPAHAAAAPSVVHTTWSLAGLQARLPAGLLERVHRRHLLNLDHVERLQRSDTGGYLAWTYGGASVEVSREAGRRLRRRFGW